MKANTSRKIKKMQVFRLFFCMEGDSAYETKAQGNSPFGGVYANGFDVDRVP
jgi:hypothetical protein